MKAALISLGSTSSIMTAEAMKKYFNEVEMLQLKNIEVSLGKDGGVYYEGKPIDHFDCVYVKGSFRYANLLRSVSAMLENKVPYMPFPAATFSKVHNKLLTHLILQQHDIPMPKTFISSTVEAAKDMLNKLNYPIVMKFPEGTQGKGVMFADSQSSAASMLDALEALNQPFIIQEFIDTEGTDVRALVVGDKVVASMKRRAKVGDLRSNTHSGGSAEAVQIDWKTQELAVKTAKALQADICGVDLLIGPLGPVVIEANISPGLQGISSVSTVDVADEIAKFLYKKTEEVVVKNKKAAAAEVMKDIALEQPQDTQSVITSLTVRGQRILLPEFVTKISGFSEKGEYTIKAAKGKVEIEKFEM